MRNPKLYKLEVETSDCRILGNFKMPIKICLKNVGDDLVAGNARIGIVNPPKVGQLVLITWLTVIYVRQRRMCGELYSTPQCNFVCHLSTPTPHTI